MTENRYVLNNIALRSWWLVPRAIIRGIGEEHRFANSVSQEEFELLKACDGKTALPPSDVLSGLEQRKLIRPAKEGEETEEFLKHRTYQNRYVPNMGINITERCNFNCLHCYEAVDNQIPRHEMSLERCQSLLKEAKECGIQNIKITGGEPLIHKDFLEIFKCVYENEMTVDRINTNAFFITEELLDEIRAVDQNILFNVSYDGAGFHDWMRNKKGAEKDLLSKIRLLVEKGFSVRAAMTVNRVNQGAAEETMNKMEELGVQEFRLIRTSEVPRWVLNAKDACLTPKEYYDFSVNLLRKYAREDHRIILNIFHVAKANPRTKNLCIPMIRGAVKDFSPDICLCGNARENITVTPTGAVFPCTPSPGTYAAAGFDFGNVFRDGLKSLLQSSKYLSFVCKGVHAISEHDPKCAACKYFKQCMGGCRLFAFGLTGDILSHDPIRCLFFDERYDKKITEVMPGYHLVIPVEED